MTQRDTRIADEDVLRPYRWLRRMVVVSVVTLAILGVLRLIAARVAEHRLQATLSRLTAAGVAIDITALEPPALNDRDNAAWYFITAATARDSKEQGARASSYESDTLGAYPPYTPLWHQLVDASEAANVQSFALSRSARTLHRANWGVIYKPPAFAILLPHLNDARGLANVLADGAERSFLRGESAEGIERVRDILHLTSSLDDENPFLVTGLVGAGIDALAAEVISRHVGSLRVGPAADDPARIAIRGLIDDLLRDAHKPNLVLASKTAHTEATGIMSAGTELTNSLWIARPTVVADLARVGERQLDLFKAVDASSYSERQDRLAELPTFARPWNAPSAFWLTPASGEPVRIARPVTHTAGGSVSPKALATFEVDALARDACAIMLAVRLYEVDHAGHWPDSLEALVPDDLPVLPTSKVADTAYGYTILAHGLPDGRDRPLLLRTLPALTSVKPTTQPSTPHDRRAIIDLTSWVPLPTTLPSSPGIQQ